MAHSPRAARAKVEPAQPEVRWVNMPVGRESGKESSSAGTFRQTRRISLLQSLRPWSSSQLLRRSGLRGRQQGSIVTLESDRLVTRTILDESGRALVLEYERVR